MPEKLTNNYISDDDRPIRPMGKNTSMYEPEEDRFGNAPPIQDHSPDFQQGRRSNARNSPTKAEKEEQEEEHQDFYENLPKRPDYENPHDSQPIGGLGGGRVKTFEEMIEE